MEKTEKPRLVVTRKTIELLTPFEQLAAEVAIAMGYWEVADEPKNE